jgi:glycosyltransferase involved in cell wall biosynthesis
MFDGHIMLPRKIALVCGQSIWGPFIIYNNMQRALQTRFENVHLFVLVSKTFGIARCKRLHNISTITCPRLLFPILLVLLIIHICSAYDVIISSDPLILGPLIAFFGKLFRKHTIFIVLGNYHAEFEKGLLTDQPSRLGRFMIHKYKYAEKILFSCIRTIVLADSRYTFGLHAYCHPKVIMWPDFGLVDVEKFKPMKHLKHEIRSKLGLNPHAIVLLFIGRLSAWSGFDVALKVHNKFCQLVKSELLVIGSGPLKGKLNKYSNVVYLGYVNHDNLPEIINACDIAIMPSREPQYGIGNTILECLACGIPIIATDVGMRRLVIKDHITGYIVNSAQEMVQILFQLVKNRSMIDEMGKNARQLVEERFSFRSFAEKMESILR